MIKRKEPVARPLAAFVADDLSAAAIEQAVAELGLGAALIVRGSIDDAAKRLSKMPTPKALIIDVGNASDPINRLTDLADVCDEGTAVIVIGETNDIALYRRLLTLGVRDYVVKPLSTDDIKQAISRTSQSGEEIDPKVANRGRLIGVVGARGGVGATSMAVNVAWLLANEQKRRTALVDLDIFFGNCGLALDLDVGRGFREALENPSRIDALFIERAMARDGETSMCSAPKRRSTSTRSPTPRRSRC
ncbi:MAG: MinD/ParA family protein [Rhodospirillales bacterium]|nr:MinD/ParA family protein [Rhodospirillales bacterium]